MKDSDVESVENCINTLIDKFQKNPYYFFSEHDLRSHLFHLISSKEPFEKEYTTKNRYTIGLIHAEYPTSFGQRYDLVVLDRKLVSNRTLKDQRILCGIELGLNRSFDHFQKDFAGEKFIKEAKNDVSIGYVLHFVRGYHKDWATIAQFGAELSEQKNAEEKVMQEFTLLKLVESDEAKVLAVKIIVES